jgi:hypothetical protein
VNPRLRGWSINASAAVLYSFLPWFNYTHSSQIAQLNVNTITVFRSEVFGSDSGWRGV